MSSQQILTLALLAGAVALMMSERLRADIVALLVVIAFSATGILTAQEAFSGFSRSTFITLIAIFILAEGLQRTGVAEQAGNLLLRLCGPSEGRLVTAVMISAALLSLFMNNLAAATLLLPAASGAARKAGVSSARVLMPLAFGTILGGMATLLTTTNIVVSSLLRSQGYSGYGLLDFAPLGLPLMAAGVLYMSVWGRRLLPSESPSESAAAIAAEADLVTLYRLGERLFRARVPSGSRLIGRPLSKSRFREIYGLNVVAIERAGGTTLAPAPETVFKQGDIVLLEGNLEEFRRRDIPPFLEILPSREWQERDLESPTTVVVEAMLSPRSTLIGRTLRESQFREKFGMSVLAIWRADQQLRTELADRPLEFGDGLLLQGPRQRLRVLRTERDLILLSPDVEEAALVAGRGWLAVGILALTLMLAALNPDSLGEIMLAGALGMVLGKVLTMDEAYTAIDWKSVFLVAGMLPVGTALSKSGTAGLLVGKVMGLQALAGPVAILGGLTLLAVLLTQTMHGAAAAAIVAPLAIEAALRSGAQPRAMAMGVALASSMAFLTPLGHPVNIMVMAPGGYRFRDFFRIGLPLTLILLVLLLALLPLVWPLASPR
ncbi:MAG: SLC13 family permease [Acidobacteria bacterium]|nr:MAG: SLC13 family permease [Acidobacteriota bacterium]